jgi:lantibiotic leader peptide-processing serine protease
MKCSKKILGFLAVLFFLCIITTMADAKDTRYVVVFENEQVPENAAQLIEAAGGRLIKTLPDIGVGIAVSSKAGFASSLSNTPGIESVSVERSLKVQGAGKPKPMECADNSRNDSCFGAQWNIQRVQADMAWKITTGSHRTVVAVIDTGIATNHPDLQDNVLYQFCCHSSEDKCIPPSRKCNPYPEDPCWGYHGTQVASIIAASVKGGGLKGVGPNLGLASYNVWEDTGTYDPDYCTLGNIYEAPDSSFWAAMLDAAKRGFKVINISLSGLYDLTDDEAKATIKAWTRVVKHVMRKGSLIVAAAGNDGIDLDDGAFFFSLPGDLPGVISVGATGIRYTKTGSFDVRAYYSNYGATIDLAAPGGDLGPHYNADKHYSILAADVWPDPICAKTESCEIWYSRNQGTSFSAPHVSAVAGLMLDINPNLSPSDVTAILKDTADDFGDQDNFADQLGSGMVNAFSAVERAGKR